MSKRVAQVKSRDSIGLKEQAPGDLLVPHHWYIAMAENWLTDGRGIFPTQHSIRIFGDGVRKSMFSSVSNWCRWQYETSSMGLINTDLLWLSTQEKQLTQIYQTH